MKLESCHKYLFLYVTRSLEMLFKCFCRFAIYKIFWLPLIPNKIQCSESNVRSVLLNFKQLFVLSLFSSLYFQIQNPLDLFRNHGLLDVDRPISETVSAAVCHAANIFDSILGILCCFIALTQYLSWFCSFLILFICYCR